MGRMNPAEVPIEHNGSTSAAVADQWKRAERERQRERERKCADLVERAWRWVDSRPALNVSDELALFAAQAITMRRTPQGLTSSELEQLLVDAFTAKTGQARS